MKVLDTGFNKESPVYGYIYGGSLLHKARNYFLTSILDIKDILRCYENGSLDFSHENENGFWFKDKGMGSYLIYITSYTVDAEFEVVDGKLSYKRHFVS